MRSVLLVAAATVAATTSIILSPVAAGASPSPTNRAVPKPGQNCVVHLAASGSVSCYDTFTEAINDATNGKITDAPRNARTAVASAAFNNRINAIAQTKGQSAGQKASTVIEISYEHSSFQGASLTWETSGGCDNSSDVDWQAGSINGWWNDRISSFRTYANCLSRHWEHSNFQGISTGYWGTTGYIGDAMNDKASSIKWI